jgi:hypothetical protein
MKADAESTKDADGFFESRAERINRKHSIGLMFHRTFSKEPVFAFYSTDIARKRLGRPCSPTGRLRYFVGRYPFYVFVAASICGSAANSAGESRERPQESGERRSEFSSALLSPFSTLLLYCRRAAMEAAAKT